MPGGNNENIANKKSAVETGEQLEAGVIEVENVEDFVKKITEGIREAREKVGPELGQEMTQIGENMDDISKIPEDKFNKNFNKPDVIKKTNFIGNLIAKAGGKVLTGASLLTGAVGAGMFIQDMVMNNIQAHEAFTSAPGGPMIAMTMMIGGFMIAAVSKAWRSASKEQRLREEKVQIEKLKEEALKEGTSSN